VPPPPPPIQYGGLILGPFASGSSALTSGLDSQIRAIAEKVKSKGKTQISLLGFGDDLSGSGATSASNVALGRDRAQAVADYLQTRLSALKLKGGWSISIGAAGTGKTSSGQIETEMVQVTLS
jgi:outer membrane protein OmpA-like peptidoglycan-associated protein